MGFDEIKDKGLRRRIKQHVLAKEHDFFAVVHPGFEKRAAEELESLGSENILDITEGGILFRAGLETCFILNLRSRTVSRFLMRLTEFSAENFRRLRKKTEEFPWELYLSDSAAIGFSTHCRGSRLYHTGRIEEELMAGIRKRLSGYDIKISAPASRDEPGSEKVFIRFTDNICTLSLDTSGELLYRRGHKTRISEAPIRETLAALILLEAKIKNYHLVIDPLCGSGTFSLEAAGILTGKNPSPERDFAFMNWPSFKKASFEYTKKTLAAGEEKEGSEQKIVLASDIREENIHMTQQNLKSAGLLDRVKLQKLDFLKEHLEIPPDTPSLIVINPPYGKRLPGSDEKFYRKLGRVITNNYPDSGFAILSPSLEHEKIMGLSYDRKILFMNGGIKVGLIVKDRF
jgi:putative N6-adenine-specific DNA methylase